MNDVIGLAPWLVGFPLIGAAVLLLGGRATDRWGHWLGVAASAASAVVAFILMFRMIGTPPEERAVDHGLWTWLSAGGLDVDLGLRLDPLSLTFVMLVTFVGTLIHVYSVAYMDHDVDRRRFFAYLNLFVAAMLTLVLADSYLLLFVGWEGVGVASYLLIGFWDTGRPSARENAVAAKKAFVMNRVGDMGLIAAMAILFATVGSVSFADVLPAAGGLSETTATAVGLCLLLAACGKSAQFPLQAWLGDAMAGPTPVSALIHAATMVTAGVYLMVRSGPILEAAPTAQLVVVVVGAVTLLFGAVVGTAKDDIKKALAASTMSQIGYMMLAAGLGPAGYAFAIFHLLTHGFFKAGLFLGAGSVMHAMGDQTDMRRFGGLSRFLPITWITMGLGWLAILGIPPFSGFWSKDGIIEAAFVPVDGQPWRAWVFGSVAVLGAAITAFYMTRLFFMTFGGRRPRWTENQHPHEGSPLMWWPLVFLGVGSAALGAVLGIGGTFTTWLEPVVGHAEHHEPVLPVPAIITVTLVLVVLGAALAFRMYAVALVPEEAPRGSFLTRAARKDLYQDAANETLVVLPAHGVARLVQVGDRDVVDRGWGVLPLAVSWFGAMFRKAQTGYVRSYAAGMAGGVLVIAVVAWLVIQLGGGLGGAQ
ncbi:NADH dehydrogenase subunit L (EC 1.6.5.3) [Promicromonospora thailandica]|uniref:NADH dehydrogenase subunit L n=1 Tax=Promicromonospora thailandica TaxID=765201 RepID=A0A9X2JX33_9MICO|nr:NADH dehydrogenase subunit L (EC 1.6.5.3) [Promicromonospora thailandica]BFF19074.1 NADH-quinone oxidoreductase subunit L [Promicromonospora thailandica]